MRPAASRGGALLPARPVPRRGHGSGRAFPPRGNEVFPPCPALVTMPSTRDDPSLEGFSLPRLTAQSSELSVTLGRARWGAGRQAEEARGVCYSAGSPGVKTPFLQYGDTVTRLESLVYAHTLSTCRVATGKPRSAPTVLLSIQCRGRSGSAKTRPGPAAEWVPHDAPTTEWSSGFKNHILGAFQQRTFFVR